MGFFFSEMSECCHGNLNEIMIIFQIFVCICSHGYVQSTHVVLSGDLILIKMHALAHTGICARTRTTSRRIIKQYTLVFLETLLI